ncbi:hypothetical protein [Nevskia sp.]|uniref:hypothetical protein n=1 Tax=Nevskia sp. TaxID=1929292 RepID=UPI003F6FEA99
MNVALLLVAAMALLGLWHYRRLPWRDPRRWLPLPMALLLAASLAPPSLPVEVGTLTVLTPGATAAQQRGLPWLAPLVALPGAAAPARAEWVPDLASALRRHPDSRRLRVIGHGLPPRDLDAARALPLQFEAAPEAGIVALEVPDRVPVGTRPVIRGRVAGPVVRVALHEPGGAQVDVATVDGQGAFSVSALARAVATVPFELRAFDAGDRLVDHAAVPLRIEPGERLSLAYRAATPDADAKYLRRWAQDAGLEVRYRAGLSEGVALNADGLAPAEVALTAASLARLDLLVIDERAWAALAAGERTALLAAVDGGLGLLLKLTGPLPPEVAADWAALGFPTTPLDLPPTVTLDDRLAMRERHDFTAAPVTLADSAALTPLLRADDGRLLAAWTPRGAGRIALWIWLDSYRLVLGGDAARHGGLWSAALGALARPRPAAAAGPQLPASGWVGERAVICGLGAAAALQGPDGSRTPLQVAADRCAAVWPGTSGWQQLDSGGATQPWYVRAADDAAGLRAARDRTATGQLPAVPAGDAAAVRVWRPLPRLPFWLGWLLLASLVWWRERRA